MTTHNHWYSYKCLLLWEPPWCRGDTWCACSWRTGTPWYTYVMYVCVYIYIYIYIHTLGMYVHICKHAAVRARDEREMQRGRRRTPQEPGTTQYMYVYVCVYIYIYVYCVYQTYKPRCFRNEWFSCIAFTFVFPATDTGLSCVLRARAVPSFRLSVFSDAQCVCSWFRCGCSQLGRGASLSPSVHSAGQSRQWVYCTLPPRNLTVVKIDPRAPPQDQVMKLDSRILECYITTNAWRDGQLRPISLLRLWISEGLTRAGSWF